MTRRVRIAAIADSHFNEARRFADCIAAHRVFLRHAADAGVDLILHAGDIYDRRSTPAERLAVSEFIRDAADIARVVIVRGNHDAPGDVELLGRLEGRLWIAAAERPRRLVVPTDAGNVVVACLPWFDKAQIAAACAAEAGDPETTNAATIAKARMLLGSLRLHSEEARALGLPVVLLGHVQVAGSQTSTGQSLIGQTVELAPADLGGVGADVAIVGHIHKHQSWPEARVYYPGSPLPQNYGEAEPKGWLFLEVGGNAPPRVEFCPLPVRSVVAIDLERLDASPVTVPPDALVRVRVRLTPDQLATFEEAALVRAYTAAGAAEVKVEAVVVTETRARAPEVVDAADLLSKLRAVWRAKGIDVAPDRVERLVGMVAAIESEVA